MDTSLVIKSAVLGPYFSPFLLAVGLDLTRDFPLNCMRSRPKYVPEQHIFWPTKTGREKRINLQVSVLLRPAYLTYI